MRINIHYENNNSDAIGKSADEYNITVYRGDGLPMSSAEVDATLTRYMLYKHMRMDVDAEDSDEFTQATGNVANSITCEVINTADEVYDILRPLDPRAHLAWANAMRQLEPCEGEQVVTLGDIAAAETLVKVGLLEVRLAQGQRVPNQYVVSRNMAYCSTEQRSDLDGPEWPSLSVERGARPGEPMNWSDLSDAAEWRLGEILTPERANRLVDQAIHYPPWHEEACSNRKFTEADIDRLVKWLLERNDERGFLR